MERAEWLKKIKLQAERLYDQIAPTYWDRWGCETDDVHQRFIDLFLERLPGNSSLLDAACGAGLYDGMLLQAGHRVLGIDQSAGMLARAREHYPAERFPRLEYRRLPMQAMDFQAEFEGIICMDAMEHICPEDWPGIVSRFAQALKPGGVFYVTVEEPDWEEVRQSYENAVAQGLPVVYGEIADKLEASFERIARLDVRTASMEQLDESDPAVYHYYPSPEQVRQWFEQNGLALEEEVGHGKWYAHFLLRKK